MTNQPSQHQQTIHPPRATPSRVLVLGSTGMVGRSWCQHLDSQKIEHSALARPEFDLMNPNSIASCINDGFDLVVNAAAWTDVDGAESNPESANQANGQAIAQIAQICNNLETTLITYSTDYVFAGDARSPYPIDAPINPINAYGQSKALGESALIQSGTDHILIRTSWVYAPWGNNFVRTIHSLARTRDQLRVVNDQQGRPTSAQHLASASLELYLKGAAGTWHLSDAGECTWHEFASEIVRRCNLQCTVDPCASSEFPRPAPRPAYSTLDISSTTQLLGSIGSWQTHLHETLTELAPEH